MMDRHFEERQTWGAQKHHILSSYLTPWARKLGSHWSELAFIDLCAGAGRYEDGPAGSPLIAARVNEELQTRAKSLVVHACEAAPENLAKLQSELAPYSGLEPPLAFVYPVAFQDRLLRILNRTRKQPTFIFLDPYGVRDLTKSDLAPILRDTTRAPTELLVRVPPTALARMAGWLAERERKPSAQKTAAGVRKLLEELEISDELLAKAAAADDYGGGPSAHLLFSSYLRKFRDRFKFVRGIPIKPRFGAAPKYFLVHGTDHPDGVLIMNDVASVAEDKLFEEQEREKAKSQLNLLKPERVPAVSLSEAVEALKSELVAGRRYHYKKLRLKLVELYGPELRGKEHRRIVDRLLDGVLEQVEGKSREGGVFVLRPRPPLLRGTGPKSDHRGDVHQLSASDRRPA